MSQYNVYSTWKGQRHDLEGRVTAQSEKKAQELGLALVKEKNPSYADKLGCEVELSSHQRATKRRATVKPEDTEPERLFECPDDTSGRTNAPGTCLNCGKVLLLSPDSTEHYGPLADNAFCKIRCGYEFGLSMALNGRRLKARITE
jgi:hypothetical protein